MHNDGNFHTAGPLRVWNALNKVEPDEDEDGFELIKKRRKKSASEYAMLLVANHSYTEKGFPTIKRRLAEKLGTSASEMRDFLIDFIAKII